MDDQELLFRAMKLCNKYKKRNGSCSRSCPLIDNDFCISRTGLLNFKDELPENHDVAAINFVDFAEKFRKIVAIIQEAEL